MRYGLRDGLSYCLIDGRPIFLDVVMDRYFMLGKSLEDAFLAHIQNPSSHQLYPAELIDQGILVPAPTSDCNVHKNLAVPARSLLELPTQSKAVEIAPILEALLIVWRVRRQLRTRPLKESIKALARYQERHRVEAVSTDPVDARVLDAASLFLRSRLHLPIETSCLLDSLALARYLARRGMLANIVFGVTDDPFSAHCWVQIGDMVVNDTVGNALAHTPIRVI